ncbi:LOW QUALITY PROTEIN: hypothetical protein SORBI_3008G174000 [Sorghum bicolor]|uniref:F-box domain-containing protein n=1 Tax=Sorghum bicolor TaxID=4558 RepID=A0A1B6PEA6_SORBI|nr:LOW QUALITY PROTEIN: hypothetical protein SORBI_3008G174000 [Sorghum bicolor]
MSRDHDEASPPPPRHQDLPDEIIEDIFARMPAKSVLRCRCLSRAWAATLHLDLANRHREEVPRLCFLPRSAAVSTVYAWSPELGKDVFTPLMASQRQAIRRHPHVPRRAPPARDGGEDVLPLQPVHGADRRASRRPHGGPPLPEQRLRQLRPRLRRPEQEPQGRAPLVLYHDYQPAGCDIYDVGASSIGHWRPAAGAVVLPPGRVRMNQMGVFVEGHVHWPTMARHGEEEEHIVSFSVSDETFGAYVTPPPGTAVMRFALAELAGCLCLLSAPHCPQSGLESVDIWLLTDYTTRSWGKHWHIDLTKLPPPPPPPEVGDDFMFHGVTPLALVDGGRRRVDGSPVSVVFLAPFGTTTAPDIPVELEFLTGTVVSLESCSGDPGAAGRRWNPPLSTARVVCRTPCHGLVLLSHRSENHHVLCNPVTRAVRSFVFLPDHGRHGCAGLGYDPSREEHVVVHLSYTSRCLETRTYAMECRVWPARDLYPTTLDAQPPIPAAVDVPPVHVGDVLAPGAAARDRRRREFAILAFDVCAETFEVEPAPPAALLGVVDSGDRMVLAELAGKLCAVKLSASMETMTVWGKDDVEGWRREHVVELQQWPEFSPRTTELAVMPMAVDPIDGRILLDTGKALGYYDVRNGTLQTVYSLETQLDYRCQNHGDAVFFIATVCEDSLLRPDDRKSRFW